MGLKRLTWIAVFLIFIFFLPSCGIFHQANNEKSTPYDSKLTERLVSVIKNSNMGIKSFKGKGYVKINKNERLSSFRLAWMGIMPSKLRLAVLSSGRLIETIATDGQYIYLRSATGEHPFFKHKTDNPDLDRMLEIPVKVNTLMDLLCGKVTLLPFDSAELRADDLGEGHILTLNERWKGIVQRVYLDGDNMAHKVEFFKRNKTLIYCAEFKKMVEMEGHSMPTHIHISNNRNISINLYIEKTYINPSLSPSKFILTDR